MGKLYATLKKMTVGLLFGILLVYVLISARDFLYPVVMALLFAYLLYPVVKKLEQWRVPRIIANLFVILTAMAAFIGLLLLLYKQLGVFLGDLPGLQEKALSNLDGLQHSLEQKFGVRNEQDDHWLREQVEAAFQFSGEFIGKAFMATTNTVTKFGLMPVYIFLMLYYRNKFEEFLFRIVPTPKHSQTRKIIIQISEVTRHYMAGVVIVILILCFINTGGLLIIGVEYALLLGILSAIMNFIPYFGTLIGGAIPLLYTLTIQGDPNKAFGVVVLFIIIQFTENNILTPNITGSKVNINPLFTILSIIIGGMIWGLPGMFVSIPLMGIVKIYCDNKPELSAFSFLLGTRGTEKHAFTLEKLKRLFGIGERK
ncbi:AI-2E family transporter [uncultured Pontibacter sp.]|uniref:AI-2E family transporter n=1 Tax=uncultured Pontibacter sp. TaxID=453356 RepID=UPI0026175406|nr:AI-2E family transporter [uncultured Pontibacter sp.]